MSMQVSTTITYIFLHLNEALELNTYLVFIIFHRKWLLQTEFLKLKIQLLFKRARLESKLPRDWMFTVHLPDLKS